MNSEERRALNRALEKATAAEARAAELSVAPPRPDSTTVLLSNVIAPVAAAIVFYVVIDIFLADWPKRALYTLFGGSLLLLFTLLPVNLVALRGRVKSALLLLSVLLAVFGIVVWSVTPPRGVLVSSNEQVPHYVPDCYEDYNRLIIGRNVIASQGSFLALAFDDPAGGVGAAIGMSEDGKIRATVRNEQREIIAEVLDDVPREPPSGTMSIWSKADRLIFTEQDQVIYKDQTGKEVLIVLRLNPKTVQLVRGTFRAAGFPNVEINVQRVHVGDVEDTTRRCILMTGPIYLAMRVMKDGSVDWRPRDGEYSEPGPGPRYEPPPAAGPRSIVGDAVKGSNVATLVPPN
jgi:hypothetical protein